MMLMSGEADFLPKYSWITIQTETLEGQYKIMYKK